MSDILDLLYQAKKNPEFMKATRQLARAAEHAGRMRAAGKLTDEEHEEFEAHLVSEYLKELPMDQYADMQADGRLEKLHLLASHNGVRDNYHSERFRNEVSKKVVTDALEDAWLSQRIDSKTFSEEAAKLGMSEELRHRLLDGDHDGVASEVFVQNNGPRPPSDFSTMQDYVAHRTAYEASQSPADDEEAKAAAMNDYAKDFEARQVQRAVDRAREAETTRQHGEAA